MNTSFWEIDNGDVRKSLAEWAISTDSVVRTRRSLAPDTLVFTQQLDVDAPAQFAVGDLIQVYRSGVPWFFGRVSRASPAAIAGEEAVAIEVQGPWWYLDNLPTLGAWKVPVNPTDPNSTLTTVNTSRLLLGQNLAGGYGTNMQEIAAAIAACVAAGGALSLGAVSAGTWFPVTEALDLTCGQVIRIMARWTPDIASFFNYGAGSAPELNILRRSDMGTQTIAIDGQRVFSSGFTARSDLCVAGVAVYFERTNSLNAKTWKVVTSQAAGTQGFGALTLTVELSGSMQQWQDQYVGTADFAADSLPWWKSKFPFLNDATDISIESATVNPPTFSSGSAGRELIAGATPQWKSDKTVAATATALISYTLTNASTGASVRKVREKMQVNFRQTELDTGWYSTLVAAAAEEPEPSGLAAAIYDALSALHYEGELVVIEDELSQDITPGTLLNVSGGRAEWETMRAMVQEVVEEVGVGRTTIRCGPPAHLSPQDFVELGRANRERRVTKRLQERVTGVSSVSPKVVGSASSAVENSVTPDVSTRELVIKDATGAQGNAQIRISVADIVSALNGTGDIKLREIDVCETVAGLAVAKKMLVLGSQTYTP
jgi:hypothetical protein